jgi:hypothetical protein
VDFAPSQLWQRPSGEKRNLDWRELYSHANGCSPAGEIARDEEFIVAEAAVGRLHDVLSGS